MVIASHGGPETLALNERPTPEPGPGEVRVQVKAVALNHLDVWVRRGVPGHVFPLPLIPGCDVAGVVEAVGPGSPASLLGSEVVVHPGVSCGTCLDCRAGRQPLCRDYGILGETRDGGCAEAVVVPAGNALPKPRNLGFEAAAAVPLVFLTAWHMLVERARVRPGERVLVHAAASGVSSAAIQIARLWGARVMATAGSDEKCALARQLGAELAVNYRTADLVAAARAWTGKRGVDVAIDHVGAATFEPTLRCLTRGGRYVICGATSGHEMKGDFRPVFFKSLSILGSTMGGSHELVEVLGHVEAGALRPIVDSVLALDQVAEGHRRLEERRALGKIVLTP